MNFNYQMQDDYEFFIERYNIFTVLALVMMVGDNLSVAAALLWKRRRVSRKKIQASRSALPTTPVTCHGRREREMSVKSLRQDAREQVGNHIFDKKYIFSTARNINGSGLGSGYQCCTPQLLFSKFTLFSDMEF